MRGCMRPMSSPMMKRMLGFCGGCCALACEHKRPTAATLAHRLDDSFLDTVTTCTSRCGLTRVSALLSNDAAESEVARRRIDVLGMTRRRPVAAAVVRRAQMRAALDDLARDLAVGLARIVALGLAPAARIFRNAAGLCRVGLVLGRPPVGRPFPDIADHVVDAVVVRRKRR